MATVKYIPEAQATSLVRYDAACRAIAEARSIDEAKDIRDKAIAMAAYARQAKNRDLEADCVEIRMRATRRLDQLRQAQKETVGLSVGTRGSTVKGARVDDKPTLASQGIDKNLAHQMRVLGAMDDAIFERKIAEARTSAAHVFRRAVREAEREQKRASYSLETPSMMLPASPTAGRRIRVARNPGKRQWMLAIGPNVSRDKLLKDIEAAREAATVRRLQQDRDALLARAAALEAEAKAMRQQAQKIERNIGREVMHATRGALPFTETYDFQCDEATDAELAALAQHELVERLLAARSKKTNGLFVRERGFWGDHRFLAYQPQMPGVGEGWTRTGSPEWLAELFPDLHAPDANSAEKQRAAP
jgi:hypothetical protein